MQDVSKLLEKFEQYLLDNQVSAQPQALYEPFRYIMKMGGKRMRPIMCLLACELFGKDFSAALPAALSVETFHNFSLVHDDIMDEAPLRRGFETVHQRYGLNAGILSGDVMLIYAYQYLQASVPAKAVNDLTKILSEVAIKVCEGQQLDMDFEDRDDVALAEYLLMIEMKTAALLAGSLKMGAVAAGASTNDQHLISEFGRLTGIAFQIQDDYLDTFGDPKKVGKRPGGDIVQNKKTCLIIKALELANEEQKQTLAHWYQTGGEQEQEKVAAVTAIFRQLGIDEWSKQLRNQYQKDGYAALASIEVDKERKAPLIALAESLLVREL